MIDGCVVKNLTMSEAWRLGQKLMSRWVSLAVDGMFIRAAEETKEFETFSFCRRGRDWRRMFQNGSEELGILGLEQFLRLRDVMDGEIFFFWDK